MGKKKIHGRRHIRVLFSRDVCCDRDVLLGFDTVQTRNLIKTSIIDVHVYIM